MKRAWVSGLLLCGCLEVGSPLYERADTVAPTVDFANVKPPLFGPDAGVPVVQAGQTIEIPFSENMDNASLRAGIVIRKDREELPLLIQAPPANYSPYVVRVSSGEMTFVSGIHSMTLRTLLIDLAGNPLEEEVTGFFRVP